MIDALLYAVRDRIRSAGFGYGPAECEITDDGRPPPRAGNFFVAVHGGRVDPGAANSRNLDEVFGFSVTLTMRVTVAADRVGDQQMARNLALELSRKNGFDAKVEQLRGFLHMNWAMTVSTNQTPNSANDNIAAWTPSSYVTVYGFAEPARSLGPELPTLVDTQSWFGDDPEQDTFALKSEMRFSGARRFQPQTASTGVFV